MTIPDRIKYIVSKLYSEERLGSDELEKLDHSLAQVENDPQTEKWLREEWESSIAEDPALPFETSAQQSQASLSLRSLNRNFRCAQITHARQSLKQAWALPSVSNFQKAAAVLLVPLLLLTGWLIFNDHSGNSQWMVLTTRPGERTHVILPDSSEVWINVGSRLEYSTAFNRKNRSLRLNGEAWFKVKPGKKLPFVVNSSEFNVMALGTEFNISAYEGDTHATAFLKEGKIRITWSPENRPEQIIDMKPGEQVVINDSLKTLRMETASQATKGNWRTGELYFGHEPIADVFRKMERWYNIKIHYHPEDFAGETLFVNLKSEESVDRLLQIMQKAIGIHFVKDDREYWIMKI